MFHAEIPVSLARKTLSALPPALLSASLEALMKRIEDRHPRLFDNLGRLSPALVRFEVTDLPHAFSLRFGKGQTVCFKLADTGDEAPGATIRGDLETLFAMLEGKIDGDTLFFSRGITLTGDSEVVVGLRNTLDREALGVMDEVLSFCGPFAEPAGRALALGERIRRALHRRISAFHHQLHKEEESAA